MERLTQAADGWRTADHLLWSPGGEPGGGRTALAVTRIGQEIAEARRVVMSDPLSLWSGNATHTGRLERAAAELTALRGDLERAASTQAAFGEQSKRLEAPMDSIEAACAEAHQAQELVREKITSPAAPAVPAQTAALRTRFAELSRFGRWTTLGAALPPSERDATAALREAHAVRDENGAPLRRRDELRGLLGAYQAKAARLGHGEDLELAALIQEARYVSWTTPCDLARADAAVARYQAVVNGLARHSTREQSPVPPERACPADEQM